MRKAALTKADQLEMNVRSKMIHEFSMSGIIPNTDRWAWRWSRGKASHRQSITCKTHGRRCVGRWQTCGPTAFCSSKLTQVREWRVASPKYPRKEGRTNTEQNNIIMFSSAKCLSVVVLTVYYPPLLALNMLSSQQSNSLKYRDSDACGTNYFAAIYRDNCKNTVSQ